MSTFRLSSRFAAGLAIILVPVLCVAAQQKRASYGPVISAYLTGLGEELNELEYQLRHREIDHGDYERAKQRLTILRRFVERYAAESREDIVPEYQVLAEDELKTLGLGREFQASELITGAELESQWRIVGVQFGGERKLTRFLVIERLQRVADGGVRESKLGKSIDPRDVIETIIVPEATSPIATRPRQLNSPDTEAADRSLTAQTKVVTPTEAQKPSLEGPRLLHVYLPEYTGKAREKKIEGEVAVRALFQRDGKIKSVKVESSLGFGLDERAVEAVKRIGFLPAQLEGKDVDAQVRIVFGFKLDKVSVYIGAAELSETNKQAAGGGKF
jgi:TonB family protein